MVGTTTLIVLHDDKDKLEKVREHAVKHFTTVFNELRGDTPGKREAAFLENNIVSPIMQNFGKTIYTFVIVGEYVNEDSDLKLAFIQARLEWRRSLETNPTGIYIVEVNYGDDFHPSTRDFVI